LFDLAQALGMSDFVQSLTAGAGQNQNQAYAQFILNLLVLRHEADRLGIRPSTSEVADRVRNLPAFNGNGGFDFKKFGDFVQNGLAPRGLGEEHIEQLVRDDDVQKYFETHTTELKSEEKLKVEVVSLALSDDQTKLTGKERIEILQKLSDRATDFTQALLEKGANFKQVAEKFQVPIQTTSEFTATAPDPKLNVDPQVGAAAFKLSVQEPNSDPIQMADGFYILHLAEIVESRPLTIDAAKPRIVEAIKNARTRELMATKGAEIVHQLRDATAAGQPLDAAIQKTGFNAERLPPFSLLEDLAAKSNDKPEPKNEPPPDLIAIKNVVAQIEPGNVSDFFPWEDGGVIAVLEKREPPDPAKYAESKAVFDQRYLANKRTIVFYEWLRDRQRDAGLQFTRG